MTSVLSSSFFAFSASQVNNVSQAQGVVSAASQPAGGNQISGYGEAFSLSLSDAAMNAMNGGQCDGASASCGASASSSDGVGGIDQLFSFLEKMITDAEQTLENIDSASTATPTQISQSDDFSASAALAGGGPLPAFLKQVDTQLHLDPAHQQALQNIANEYSNADNTPATVQSIAGALQQAGI